MMKNKNGMLPGFYSSGLTAGLKPAFERQGEAKSDD
jgi:hypothetical protein